MDLNKEIKKLKFIAEYESNIPIGSIDGGRRLPEHCLARQVIASIMMFDLGMTPAKVSEFMNRHRSSFYYYHKEHETYMSNDKIRPKYNKLYNTVRYNYFKDDSISFKNKPLTEKRIVLDDIRKKKAQLLSMEEQLEQEITQLTGWKR